MAKTATLFFVLALSVSLWGQRIFIVTESTALYSSPGSTSKEVGFIHRGQSVIAQRFIGPYAFVRTNNGMYEGWTSIGLIAERGCYRDSDQDQGEPRAILKYRTDHEGAGYSKINGNQPTTIGEWFQIREELANLIPYILRREMPIPNVETNSITLMGLLTSAIELNTGEVKLILNERPIDNGRKISVTIPSAPQYCRIHQNITKLLRENGSIVDTQAEEGPFVYAVKTPVLIEVRGFIFFDFQALGLSPRNDQSDQQSIRIPTVAVRPAALTVCPVLGLSEVDLDLDLNPQRPNADEVIESALTEIEHSLHVLTRSGIDVAPETLKAVEYMKLYFTKPGYIPDRYISVLKASGELLSAVASKTHEIKSIKWSLPQSSSQKSLKPTEIQKDIEDNLQLMARVSQESSSGIVRPLLLSVTTMATKKGANPIEVSGWEIFYMEYFLRHVQKDVGPSSFKNPSSPSVDELPPGRYLLQAVDPVTKQKGEIKVFTITKPDSLSLFVP